MSSVRTEIGRPGSQFVEYLISAEHFGFAVCGDFGGGQNDFSVRPFDGGGEVLVVGRVGGLRELDVHGDHLRAGFTKVIDHARLIGSRKRELESAGSEFLERSGIDLDEHDVRRRPLRSADREAGVDRLQFGAPEQVRRVHEDAEPGGQKGNGDQQGRLPSPPRRSTHSQLLLSESPVRQRH